MKKAHKIFDGSQQTPEEILSGDLRRLAKQMKSVARDLQRCGINGCKTRSTELLGAALIVNAWAKYIDLTKENK